MIKKNKVKLIRVNLLSPVLPRIKATKDWLYRYIKYFRLGRFKDRTRVPRKWWFPVLSLKINRDENERKRQHEETSRTVNRALIGLTVFCLFCVLTLSTSDLVLLTTDAVIKLPFANIEVDFNTFIVIAPIILTGLLIYLHIFYGHLRLIDKPEEDSQMPVLFNLPYRGAQILSLFLIYWQTPFVLAFFFWKSIPQPNAAVPFFVMIITTAILVFIQIRRRHAEYRSKNRYLWYIIIYLIFVFIDKSIVTLQGKPIYNSFLGEHIKIHQIKILHPLFVFPFKRKLQLEGADLSKVNLEGFNLSQSDLRNVNLSHAQISGAFLEQADLRGANLTSVVGRGTHFTEADLEQAIIEKANLERAVFNQANLRNASLKGANLRRAMFRRSILIKVILVEADLREADLSYANLLKSDLTNAKLDGAFIKHTILKQPVSKASGPSQEQKKSMERK